MVTGVVRQDVKRSAGKSGFMGKICVELHAASWMQELKGGNGGTSLGDLLLLTISYINKDIYICYQFMKQFTANSSHM